MNQEEEEKKIYFLSGKERESLKDDIDRVYDILDIWSKHDLISSIIDNMTLDELEEFIKSN